MTTKKANGKNGQTSEAELKKLRTHIADVSVSIAKHKTALTTIPEDAKHVSVRVMQQNLIDKLGEELQRSQTRLKRLEDDVVAAARVEEQRQIAKPREEKLEWLKTHPPTCDCGFVAELVQGITNPVVIGSGLGDPNARITLAYNCTNPSLVSGKHRFWLDLDKDVVFIDGELKPRTPTVKRKGSTPQTITLDKATMFVDKKV